MIGRFSQEKKYTGMDFIQPADQTILSLSLSHTQHKSLTKPQPAHESAQTMKPIVYLMKSEWRS